jgi:serine/threonine protein kinase
MRKSVLTLAISMISMNTLTLPGYQISASISDGLNTCVYRGIRESDEQPVIIKILKAEFPTLEEITRLKNEYKITQHLHVESIVKSYSIETYQNRVALILEDFGGQSLSQILSKRLNLTAFFKHWHSTNLSTQLTASKLHYPQRYKTIQYYHQH